MACAVRRQRSGGADGHADAHPSGLDRRDEGFHAEDVHGPREIVGEHVQGHLGGNLRQALHQEVRRSHSHLQRAKGMLGRLATQAHGLRVLVEALLDSLQYMLMLPARDPPLLAGCAAWLEHTVAACICPIAPQFLAVLLVGVVVLQLFAGWTAIHILIAEINKVLLAEATLGLNARGDRFGKRYRNAGLVTREDFLAAVVAPIGNVFRSMTARAFVAAGAFTFSAQR